MRLAYEQGVLSRPSINWWQRWALTYMLSWNRWDHEAKEEAFIKHQLAINDWERYVELFGPPEIAQAFGFEEDEVPISPDEFSSIDEWLEKADRMRKLSGADLEPQPQGPEDGWI